jgi:branched-chain amino acid transport system permease protein
MISATDLVLMGLTVSLALSLNLISGFAGFLVFSQAAFYGVGAYGVAILAIHLGWGFGACVLAAVVLAAVAGLVAGLPILRTSGTYFAMVTWGLAAIGQSIANNVGITGGPFGIGPVPAPSLFGIRLEEPATFAVVCWVVVGITLVVYLCVMNSRLGWGMRAVGEDFRAAQSLGIPRSYALLGFAISAGLAGLAGAFYGYFVGFVTSPDFGINLSILLMLAVLLGGLGSVTGSVLGAVLIVLLQDYLRSFSQTAEIIFGVMLVLAIHLKPDGLLSARTERRWFNAILGRVRRRGGALARRAQ